MRGLSPSLLQHGQQDGVFFQSTPAAEDASRCRHAHSLVYCEGRLPGLCVNGPITRHADRVVGAIRIGAMKITSRRSVHTTPHFWEADSRVQVTALKCMFSRRQSNQSPQREREHSSQAVESCDS
jgi:hypothetical protein